MYPPAPPRNPEAHSSFVDHTPFALPLAPTTRIEDATLSQQADPLVFGMPGRVLPPPPWTPNPEAQRVARGHRLFTFQGHEYHTPPLDPLPGPLDDVDPDVSWADFAHQNFAAAAVARFYDAMFFGVGEFTFGGFFVRETRNWGWGQMDLRDVFIGRATAVEEAREAFESDSNQTTAVQYLDELLNLEQLLHLIAHNGVRVFMHPGIRRAQATAYRAIRSDIPPDLLEQHLEDFRTQGDILSSPQARTNAFWYTLYLLDENWVDPRVGWEAGPSFRNTRDRVIQFDPMLEFLHRFANAGFATPDGGLEGEDLVFDEPAAILEGAALEEYLSSLPLRPLNVYGAFPPPLPSPSPSPSPTPPPPPPAPIVVSLSESSSDENFIRLLSGSPPGSPTQPIPSRRRRAKVVIPRRRGCSREPPPVPDPRKRARVEEVTDSEDDMRPKRVFRRGIPTSPSHRSPSPIRPSPRRRTTTGPRADREDQPSSRLRSATRLASPPIASSSRNPPPVPRSRRRGGDPPVSAARPLLRVPGMETRLFPGEAYRAVGDVVRGLVPGCGACMRRGRICAICAGPNEGNASRSRKGRFACDTCSASHSSCPEWVSFRDGYIAHQLDEFSFQFWEHLGGGNFALLEADHRLRDLTDVARERSFRSFCYDLLPLQNTDRQRRAASPPPPPSFNPQYPMIEVLDDSEESLPRVASSPCGKGKAAARVEEDEMEVDERQSDPEEGEWRSPRVRIPPRVASPVIMLDDFDLDAEPVPPPSVLANVAGPSSARSTAGPPRATNPSSSRSGGLFSTGPSIVVRPPEFQGMPLESFIDPQGYGPHTMGWDAQAFLQFYETNPVEHRLEAHEYMESVLRLVGDTLRERRAGRAQGSGGAKGKGKGKEKAPQ